MARQNGITIEEAMNIECMSKSRIIAGQRGITNIISNVNIMADPDIMSWVGEGELLLTTGYSLNKISIEEQKKLIREAKKQNLVGLGIKIKPYLEKMPKEVLDLAEKIGFTIIDIDQNISLSDVMTPIVNEIFDRKSYLLSKIEKIYEQFMGAMLNRMDIYEIIELTSKNIKNPVMFKLDFPNRKIEIFRDICSETKIEMIDSFNTFYKKRDKREAKKMDETVENISGKYIDRIVIPIIVKDSVFGHIFTWGSETTIGGYEISVLEVAATTLALEVLKAISVREVEIRHKSEFIEDLVSLDIKRKEKAIDRLSYFNLDKKSTYISLTMRIKDSRNSEKVDMPFIQENISSLHNKLDNYLEENKLTGIIGTKIEKIIILISLNEKTKIDNIIGDIEKIVKSQKSINVKIGVGREYCGIENFYKSYEDSIKSLSAGRILGDNLVTKFDDLGIYKLLCQDQLTGELERFYDTTIKPLSDYDKVKSTELVKTLEIYFKSNGNLKKMSEYLYTHYNTVLYRMQRIKEITGMDLENSKDRLSLEVSLKIGKVLRKDI